MSTCIWMIMTMFGMYTKQIADNPTGEFKSVLVGLLLVCMLQDIRKLCGK